MGNFYMESTQINYRRDEKLKTVDQKLQELSETSAIDTDIAPVFKSTSTYQPGDMVYYRNKLYVFNVEHTGAWAAADVTATDVTTEISSLKSGLTNYEATTNSALDLPENTGKNLIPLSVSTIKAINTSGTWNDNTYTFNGVTFTVQTDANGNITGIKATGTATGGAAYMLLVSVSGTNPFTTKMLGRTVILNGCPAGGGENTYKINIYYAGQANVVDTGSGATKTYPTTGDNNNIALNVSNGYEIATGGIMFYPMLRMSDIADATFAPYIPSVESRIEAVESGLIKITKESYENITVNAGSKKWVANVGLLTDNVVITAYSNVSDVIAYVATGTTTHQIYLYNPTNADITNNVTVMVAKV